MQIKEIPISSIIIKENHRVIVLQEEINSLAASIKEQGLEQPIGVYPIGVGKYEYAFGHRRILACKKLGHKTIMAIIKKRPAKPEEARAEIILSNVTENLQRSNPSFPEFGRSIEQLHETLKIPLTTIAKRLGKPEKIIREIYHTWTKLPKKYREKVRFMEKRGKTGGGVGASVALRILNLKKRHGLSSKNEGKLFKHANSEDITKDNLVTLGHILKTGVDFDSAISDMSKYKSFYVEVIADPKQVEDYKKTLGLPNTNLVFKRILYGQCPALDKPKFLAV